MAEAARTAANRRWTIGVLLGAGVLVNYFDRISLSVAGPQLQLDLNLSPAEMGLLFSAFFWSYSLFQLPGGILLDRFGIKTVGRWGSFPVGRGLRRHRAGQRAGGNLLGAAALGRRRAARHDRHPEGHRLLVPAPGP